jgi:hypothetical protein
VWDWKRGDEVAAWQSELFDVFPADCDRLLNLPAINVPDVIAEMLDVPVYEMRHTIWGAPHTQTRQIAAQLLRLGLADCCARAGRAGLSTPELGTAAFEFALGVLALDMNKENLSAALEDVLTRIDSDSLSVVKASRDRDIGDPHLEAGSWIRELSGLRDAPAFWASQQVRALGNLKAFAPPRQKPTPATGSEKPGGKRVVVPRRVFPVIKHP